MLNNPKKELGYRDIIYNIKQNKFYTFEVGDQFRPLDIETGTPSGGTGDRPSEPNVGDLFWDTDLDQLVIWNGSAWEPVGSGGSVTVPNGATGDRPASPEVGDLYWDTTLGFIAWFGTVVSWEPATPSDHRKT